MNHNLLHKDNSSKGTRDSVCQTSACFDDMPQISVSLSVKEQHLYLESNHCFTKSVIVDIVVPSPCRYTWRAAASRTSL